MKKQYLVMFAVALCACGSEEQRNDSITDAPAPPPAKSQDAPVPVPCDFSKNLTQDMLTQAGLTIEPGTCYNVPKSLEVSEGTLTLTPGVTLRFAQSTSLRVTAGGILTAQGTAVAPVTFKGAEQTRGYWAGIKIATKSPKNICDFCVIENGGSGAWTGDDDDVASLYLGDFTYGLGGLIKVTNSTIRGSGGYAIMYARAASELPGFENNLITDNARTASVHVTRAGGGCPARC